MEVGFFLSPPPIMVNVSFVFTLKKMGHTMQFCTWLFSLEAPSTSAYNIYPFKKTTFIVLNES